MDDYVRQGQEKQDKDKNFPDQPWFHLQHTQSLYHVQNAHYRQCHHQK